MALAALAALAAGAGGCRGVAEAHGGQEPLEFWALGREGEVVQELVSGFERLHPEIRVTVQQIPFMAGHEKLLTAFVGNSTPDVAHLGSTWVPELVAVGALADLDSRLAASRTVRAADFFPGSWDTGVIDGKVYGIPWYVDTRVLFYRRDLLTAAGCDLPPRTWSAWRRCMEKVKARSGPEAWAILLPVNEWDQAESLSLQLGAPLLRDGGRYGAFQDPRSRRAVGFYLDLFRDRLAPIIDNTQTPNLAQLFSQGTYAMYVTGAWNLGEFRRRLPAAFADSWTTAPLPVPDEDAGAPAGTADPGVAGGKRAGGAWVGGANLAVFRASRHQRAAWELIEYLSQPAQQARFYALLGDLPARRAAWQDAALAGDPQVRAFGEQLLHSRPAPKVPEWEQIATRSWQHSEAAIRGQRTLDQALADLDRDVDHILVKRRWLLSRGVS